MVVHSLFGLKIRSALSCMIVFDVLFCATLAYAHVVALWPEVIDGKVHVEAFLGNGAKIKNHTLVVIDKNGKKLLEGKTDEHGEFEFEPPVKDEMTILLDLDHGHGTEFTIEAKDFLPSAKPTEKKPTDAEKKQYPNSGKSQKTTWAM